MPNPDELVLNRLLTLEEERARRRWLEEFNDGLPFALMSLSWELDPVFANEEAFEHCAAWNFGPRKARMYHARSVFHTPPDILSACGQLREDIREVAKTRRREDAGLEYPFEGVPRLISP